MDGKITIKGPDAKMVMNTHFTNTGHLFPGFPEARRCHSSVQFENSVYICGGYNGEKIFSDLWKLDLKTLYWYKITDMPKPVYFHAADVTPVSKNIIVFICS
jgi:hypothetical protein